MPLGTHPPCVLTPQLAGQIKTHPTQPPHRYVDKQSCFCTGRTSLDPKSSLAKCFCPALGQGGGDSSTRSCSPWVFGVRGTPGRSRARRVACPILASSHAPQPGSAERAGAVKVEMKSHVLPQQNLIPGDIRVLRFRKLAAPWGFANPTKPCLQLLAHKADWGHFAPKGSQTSPGAASSRTKTWPWLLGQGGTEGTQTRGLHT